MLHVHKKIHELQYMLFQATWGFESAKIETRTYGKIRSRFGDLRNECGPYWPVADTLVGRAWAELAVDEQVALPKERLEAAIQWLAQAHAEMHNFDDDDRWTEARDPSD